MTVKEMRWPALTAVAGAALLAVLDGTVVAVALESLADSFDARIDQVVWATIAYLLAVAAVLPVLNWLTVRYGPRTMFTVGLLLFVAGSALTALAWSVPALIGFRVVQGLGGGMIEPTAMTLAATLSPPERMGRVMGVMAAVINVAPVAGPLVGGLLLQTGHWQWIFLVNLPLGAVVLVAVLSATRSMTPAPSPSSSIDQPRADIPGLLMLTFGFVALLFALNRSGEAAGPSALLVLVGLAGAGLLIAYVPYARRLSRPPALDLRLLGRPGFGAGLAIMGLTGLVMFAMLTSLPLFGAERFGLTGLEQGVLVSALGLGLLVSMSSSGRLSDRLGARPLVAGGSAVTVVTTGTFALAHDELPLPVLFALFVLVGLAFGCTAAPTVAGAFRMLEPGEQSAGSTALFMTVQFGASLGVTLLGLLPSVVDDWVRWLFLVIALAQVLVFALSSRLRAAPPAAPMDHLTSGQPPHFSSS
ncbi:MFS transporter [Kineosporia rhizophila]|uniref:MFS transporter n=1 Tax=Kineosporia rhizophila TaxID=84633 RepID=UPI000ABD39E8|nr:MFS transporter [Kineosporia rhizophila]MCE0534488.1 MFS transporter [Kineosporia rhizophila]